MPRSFLLYSLFSVLVFLFASLSAEQKESDFWGPFQTILDKNLITYHYESTWGPFYVTAFNIKKAQADAATPSLLTLQKEALAKVLLPKEARTLLPFLLNAYHFRVIEALIHQQDVLNSSDLALEDKTMSLSAKVLNLKNIHGDLLRLSSFNDLVFILHQGSISSPALKSEVYQTSTFLNDLTKAKLNVLRNPLWLRKVGEDIASSPHLYRNREYFLGDSNQLFQTFLLKNFPLSTNTVLNLNISLAEETSLPTPRNVLNYYDTLQHLEPTLNLTRQPKRD